MVGFLYVIFGCELNLNYALFLDRRDLFYRGDDDFNFGRLRRGVLLFLQNLTAREKGEGSRGAAKTEREKGS